MEEKFNPLEWAAASNNNAATSKGQIKTGQVINHQGCAEAHPRTESDGDTKAELLAVINELLARRVNITESYMEWIKVGWALAETLGAEGREYFHQLSAMSSKYNERECEAKWHSLLRSNSGRVTANTIFWMAEQAGVDIAVL